MANKVFHQFEDRRLGVRCHVYLLDLYFSKVSEAAKEQGIMYLRPVSIVSEKPSAPWFTSIPVGKNTLSEMMKRIQGRKTNHSLRAYVATTLFQAGIPENVIQDRRGHRSLEGLRKYERISKQQQEAACKALLPTSTPMPYVPATSAPMPATSVSTCTMQTSQQ